MKALEYPGTPELFGFARERYRMLLKRRAGEPRPWTNDAVIRDHYFCNVFREDDRVTEWFRDHVRGPQSEDPRVIFNTIMFRFVNRISSGERLLAAGLFEEWDRDKFRAVGMKSSPFVTAAYIIKTPNGMDKITGLIKIFDEVWRRRDELTEKLVGVSLQDAHGILQALPWIGGFMAYEFVTDLRHTFVLRDAPDKMTWANPGPGASKGLQYLKNGSLDGPTLLTRHMLPMMQELLELSRQDEYWPSEWPQFELREIEHLLCELSKYAAGKQGIKLKRRYPQKPEKQQ